MEGIRRELVLGLVLIEGTVIEHTPCVGPLNLLVIIHFLISERPFLISKLTPMVVYIYLIECRQYKHDNQYHDTSKYRSGQGK